MRNAARWAALWAALALTADARRAALPHDRGGRRDER
jgi:hypothetical protein